MNDIDLGAFSALFREACLKCFGHAMAAPLTETEAKLFYTKVFDATGLVIGWKSIKNYSGFLFGAVPGKTENPSVATLDTLARYVVAAPYTTELERKGVAGHYPYWYGYRERWVAGRPGALDMAVSVGTVDTVGTVATAGAVATPVPVRRWFWWLAAGLGITVMVVLGLVWLTGRLPAPGFRDDFHSLSADSMAARGWWVANMDTGYWNKRGAWKDGLTLYTLQGDNWPDPVHPPVIHNLLQRRIPCDCFTLEWHLNAFVPRQNWQQAGILLSEDTGFSGKSIRVSIAYNDYNGVYPRKGTILLQAIISSSSGKPEEIAHVPLFATDSLRENPVFARNLDHSALRIEKRGDRFRILYADGVLENTSFREITVHEFSMQPRYVGLFATKGFVDSAEVMPARFSWFSLDCGGCK